MFARDTIRRLGTRLGRRLRRAWRLTRAVTQRAAGAFFRDGCTQRAAAISYYSLFAVFPLAILAVVVFGLFISDDQARREVVDFLLSNLPIEEGSGRADLENLLVGVTQNSGALGAVGLAGLVFSASGLMTAIRHALNDAFDREDEARPPVTGKLFDIGLVLVAGVFIVLSLGLTLAVQLVGDRSEDAGDLGARIAQVALGAGELLPLALAIAVFTFLYRTVPSGKVRLRDVWPGAIVAGLGYELAKTGFGIYLDNFGRYSAVYGSIGAVVAFLVFIFIAANVFLLGGEVASEWPGVRDADERELDGDGDGPGLGARVRGLFVRSRDGSGGP